MLAEELDINKALMLQHMQELMEDAEVYGWRVVTDYHAAWLLQIEQGRAAWGDENKKIKLRRLQVWHRLAPGSGQPSNTPIPAHQA